MPTFEDHIKEHALCLGFDLVGITAAGAAESFDRFRSWLDHGYAGEMHYMERHAEARRHPSSIMAGVRTVVVVAMNYHQRGKDQEAEAQGKKGKIAQYAQGADYHDVIRARLKALLEWIQQEKPGTSGRAVVDTAPLLEREFARRAGLGWFGKNTMLLNKQLGSFFFLGALLLDLELQADAPHETNHCGTCTACLDACPTQAFPEAGVLDARRCISYLTIELRGPIPQEFQGKIGGWLFGCDVCQEVCPWNRKAPPATEPEFGPRPELTGIDPAELVHLSEAEFRERFRGTALTRAKHAGLVRNAAIVLEHGTSAEPKGFRISDFGLKETNRFPFEKPIADSRQPTADSRQPIAGSR